MEVFPRSSSRPTSSFAERALYSALAKAPLPGWRAWHSLRLRTDNAWEGEGDFLLAHPQRGLLLLEVKGGAMELRDGRWLQNGKPLPKAPRDQGLTFIKRLVGELKRQQLEVPPFGVALAFPDCEFSAGPDTGELRGLVLGQRDLPHLELALPPLVEKALPDFAAPKSGKWLDAVHRLWGETWAPTVRLPERAEGATARRVALDTEQLLMLDMADSNRRALVEGGAGTGKTLIATELCRRRARTGQRALYLSFTDALARAVDADFAAEFPGERRPRAASIRQFAAGLLAGAGQPVTPKGADFWKDVSLQAACDALPPQSERPDLVMVDEGQDFEDADWTLVEQLAGERGLWCCRDTAQAFWADRHPPEALFRNAALLRLLKQYRCPDALFAFASRYTKTPSPAAGGVPEASVLRLSVAPDEKLLDRVRHELDELRRQGVHPEDIAVLSLAGQTWSQLFKEQRLGSHVLCHADHPEAANHVVADTFLRFKGLERPFVLVTETAGPRMSHYETRMHIALTRATVAAVVVTTEAGVVADPHLTGVAR